MIKIESKETRCTIDFTSSPFAVTEGVNAILHICDKIAAEKNESLAQCLHAMFLITSSRAQDFKRMIELEQECENHADT